MSRTLCQSCAGWLVLCGDTDYTRKITSTVTTTRNREERSYVTGDEIERDFRIVRQGQAGTQSFGGFLRAARSHVPEGQ